MKTKLIVIATGNESKYREIRKILKPFIPKDLNLISTKGLKNIPTIIEDGRIYLENASKKAKILAKKTKTIVIADDSGLEVNYLKNKPGINSARFSGRNSTDKKNNRKLLKLLKGVPREKRKAKFVCTAVGYFPKTKKIIKATAKVSGYITEKEMGKNGFGYDPIFFYPPIGKTFAQIPAKIKNSISHRGKAFKKLGRKIRGYLKVSSD